MEAAVQRSDSQKLQTNGPRVSFNRDVHVKRIGTRPNEKSNYKIETTNLQPPSTQHLRRELPADLSEEGIRKEAAFILAQAEKIKCKAESGKNIPSQIKNSNHKRSIPNKFHSLPTRKKKPVERPVSRSVSDASSKKSKKPSIFNIFSRKSDSNINQEKKGSSRLAESSSRSLVRSKSDVGSYKEPKVSKKRNFEKEDLATGSGKSTQLSPIIENTQKEEYFEELFNRERRKSEAITAHEKNATELKDFLSKYNTEPKLSGNIGYTNHKDLDLVPSKPIAETIQALQQDQTKALEDMHCSQLPARKPTLTKGLTVNGMVKRLSMERFSPPPTISGPAFSYTRPNENIIYAQLAEEEKPLRRPTAFNTPLRQSQNGITNRNSVDVLDHPSSHHTSSAIMIGTPSRVISSPAREPFSPVGPTMIRIQNSPSPWQQLSPRNLSDDDEGLGVETRKYFEEDAHHQNYDRSRTHFEVPIVPIMRSVTPPDLMQPKKFDEINTLSRRRANLESRIRSRRFAQPENVSIEYRASPDRNRVREEFIEPSHRQYLTPEREDYSRYHKLRSEEIMNKYSPERSHLDMIAPKKSEGHRNHSSRYVHTKYYDDGTGGVKEVYEREAKLDDQGKPIVRESRRRERFDSPGRGIENNVMVNDYEPRSLDPQLTNNTNVYRSSPDNHKFVSSISQVNSSEAENWQNSLKRDKRQQRSFDKGDSGIENDFRKETFNGDRSSKWHKRTFKDDVTACELFIKKERRHTEDQHPQRKKYDFVYRERSIDDGSHFDPRLDKYPKSSSSTLRRSGKENPSPAATTSHSYKEDNLKQNKKVGGFHKVKLLFSSNRKKEHETGVMVNGKSESAIHTGSGIKDKYMVKEEEMRSRYREHRSNHQNDLREPKISTDISMRRRLSTPKASPLLKRTSSESARKNSPLASKNSTEVKPEKSSWFKSIDRRSKSKSKEKLDPPASVESGSTQTLKHRAYRSPPPAPPIPPKNFRFFGDTDLDSNPPTVSRVNTTPRSRPSLSTLNRTQKYSQSAYHLDRINHTPQSAESSRLRSSSLQNLEEDGTDEIDSRKRRHYSRSRNLDDISESGSETEDNYRRQPLTPVNRTVSREKLDHSHRHDDRKKNERHQTNSSSTLKKSPDHPSSIDTYKQKVNALPKPLRSAERRYHAREHERLPDSSGTEGESSMQSQRSIVYLHATTIGAIPQPYQSTSQQRRAASREDLRKTKLQPMTRSVSRSVSMLAPWKPKHMSEGYEINYSQEQNEKDKKLQTLPRKNTSTQYSTSTLTRNKRADPPTRSRRQTFTAKSKDDMSSIRNSSSTSAPKSNLSSTIDSRKETLRRK